MPPSDLPELISIGLRRREVEGFAVEGDRLNVPSQDYFTSQPINILRLFEVAQRRDLDIHPTALRLVTRNLKLVKGLRSDPEANRLFLEMLTSRNAPETVLRHMNEAGVLGRFIPDFRRVVALSERIMPPPPVRVPRSRAHASGTSGSCR